MDGSVESASGSSGGTGSSGGSGSSGSVGDDATAHDAAVEADGASTADAQTVYGDAGVCAACSPGSVCVEDGISGGALILPDDAGQCPAGRVPSGGTPDVCVTPPTYHCAKLPAACNTALGATAVAHCTCAPELCPTADQCTDPTPTLMKCSLLAP
jgi:hypothetical protein